MSVLVLSEGATPSTPASGLVKVFINASGQLCTVDDMGTVVIYAEVPTTYAYSQYNPGDPTGTATASPGVMMGLSAMITPAVSGRVQITVTGTIANATAIGDGADARLRYGTGAAPANGDAVSGTTAGGLVKYVASTTAGKVPFALSAIVTGLTVGVAYWIDVSLGQTVGGTATIKDLSVASVEF